MRAWPSSSLARLRHGCCDRTAGSLATLAMHAWSQEPLAPWMNFWPSTEDFYKEFVSKEKSDPDYVHASCAAATVVLADAIERAGSTDKNKVRDALAATNVSTFYGPIKFSANGMNEARELPIIQVQNKSIKVLHPANIKDGELTFMK